MQGFAFCRQSTDQLSSFADSFPLPVYTGFFMFVISLSFGVLIRTKAPLGDEILIVAREIGK